MRYSIILILFIALTSLSQIKIDKARDFWNLKVDLTLNKIKRIDTVYYSHILSVCDTISFNKECGNQILMMETKGNLCPQFPQVRTPH